MNAIGPCPITSSLLGGLLNGNLRKRVSFGTAGCDFLGMFSDEDNGQVQLPDRR
jgi:hypothetical protein